MKPYSEACDQNKVAILEIIRKHFVLPGKVLEIGSGSGQHAVYFSQHLPHLLWQPTGLDDNLPGINLWRTEARLDNILPPLCLDVSQAPWSITSSDYVFSANTVHIMSWPMVEKMFLQIGETLTEGGSFCLYGPFNYDGCYTSESNTRFDAWLKARDPFSGIRDFHELQILAQAAGLLLVQDYEMPANNHTLVWQRQVPAPTTIF